MKRNVGFWVSQGLLKEISSDVYRLMQEWNFDHKAAVKRKSISAVVNCIVVIPDAY